MKEILAASKDAWIVSRGFGSSEVRTGNWEEAPSWEVALVRSTNWESDGSLVDAPKHGYWWQSGGNCLVMRRSYSESSQEENSRYRDRNRST